MWLEWPGSTSRVGLHAAHSLEPVSSTSESTISILVCSSCTGGRAGQHVCERGERTRQAVNTNHEIMNQQIGSIMDAQFVEGSGGTTNARPAWRAHREIHERRAHQGSSVSQRHAAATSRCWTTPSEGQMAGLPRPPKRNSRCMPRTAVAGSKKPRRRMGGGVRAGFLRSKIPQSWVAIMWKIMASGV